MPARATARMVAMVVLDLLVASGNARHGLVVEMHRDVFDRLEFEAVALDLLDQRADVRFFPSRVAGEGRIVHLQYRSRRSAAAKRSRSSVNSWNCPTATRIFIWSSSSPLVASGGWWAHQDLNLEPDRYERSALTN